MTHGTLTCYYSGCRCPSCLAISTAKGRRDELAAKMRQKNARVVHIRETLIYKMGRRSAAHLIDR